MPFWRGPLLAVLCACLLSGSAGRSRALPSDAYVWQRRWTPALTDALRDSASLVRAWRVLVAQADSAGRLHPVAVDWSAVTRPAIMVVRLDGSLSPAALDTIPAQIEALVRSQAGPVAGLEIDHDCGTASLPGYGRLLTAIRRRVDPAIPLSITALPAWLASPNLSAVLAPVTEAVLQVHAVQNPRAGLFDPAQARRWADAMSRRTSKPFRLALPAYGSRVTWRADGRLLAVESERPLLAGGDEARELMASATEVAALLRALQRDPPDHLAGIVWFRLPTETDVRAWSPATWRAVVRGEAPVAATRTIVQPGSVPGTSDVLLVNDGDIDAPLPASVALPRACPSADGINGYALEDGTRLRRIQVGLLRPHQRLAVGWTRCESEQPHAAP